MDTAVNYVWMSPNISAPRPIPSPSFYHLQENAERYPNINFRLWVEQPTVCEPYHIPDNVTVSRLSAIPAFSQIPLLQSTKEQDIYPKVDAARLVVLRHALLDKKRKHTEIYSDFDVRDVAPKAPGLIRRLRQYGAAFGGIVDPESGATRKPFGNGYMAFRATAVDLLDHVIEKVSKGKATGHNRSRIHFVACRAFDSWAREESNGGFPLDWQQKVAGLPILFPPFWRDDKNLMAKPANLTLIS